MVSPGAVLHQVKKQMSGLDLTQSRRRSSVKKPEPDFFADTGHSEESEENEDDSEKVYLFGLCLLVASIGFGYYLYTKDYKR